MRVLCPPPTTCARLSTRGERILLDRPAHFTFCLYINIKAKQKKVSASTNPTDRVLKRWPDNFFCLKALEKNKKWHHFCAHAQCQEVYNPEIALVCP